MYITSRPADGSAVLRLLNQPGVEADLLTVSYLLALTVHHGGREALGRLIQPEPHS